ncbi:uncharacterized protein PFL1_00343 [Pseudozyma flocculosa PF-1]|uniref:Related to protein FR, involved in hyphal branching n=1 Tax=Pseudozyma flocculosa TaxID=84751 RepID=A0A5C3ETB8_9BASI|nr:uncharacterized protein PFL1_00343 [Pseudozyma flocculosa PF-1]EPQ32146.1 hypothetical protein PFL1_00343 [Pseudozyma flocculosa PF-1]SPO34915.1 related to protein FR, involved in hyphal branching [Pseudozyma flocculosa]
MTVRDGTARSPSRWRRLLSPALHVQCMRAAWVLLVFYYERVVFDQAATTHCPWPRIEAEASATGSFDILVVTDPQIIDAFTYPDLPLPRVLFPIVRHFSDRYLRNAWRSLILDPSRWAKDERPASPVTPRSRRTSRPRLPDAVVWMGDLTDGGRREMDRQQWGRLHDRFDSMFALPRLEPVDTASSVDGERLVLTRRQAARDALPVFYMAGNHDIGLPKAPGQLDTNLASSSSRSRFIERYGIDSDAAGHAVRGAAASTRRTLNARIGVSLPSTSGADAGRTTHELVLVDAEALVGMQRAGGGPYDTRTPPAHQGQLDGPLLDEARTAFPDTFDFIERIANESTSPARILFSHVPLHRPDASRCNHPVGSTRHRVLREAPRPLHQDTDRASTYQNLLGPEISHWLLAQIDPVAVFSGDDHDHCEATHRRVSERLRQGPVQGFEPGEIPELTVKSLSMTEGVRLPGFARLSLFTPHSGEGLSAAYRPCLMPDQIGIWTQVYVPAFLLSLGVLFALRNFSGRGRLHDLLPTSSSMVGHKEADMMRRSAQRKAKRRDSHDDAEEGLLGAVPSGANGTAGGSWLKDLGAVCIIAIPFWLVFQAGLL